LGLLLGCCRKIDGECDGDGQKNPTEDKVAEQAGLPPVDSVDMRSLLFSRAAAPPRDTVLLSANALIKHDMKLLVGVQYGAAWGGPLYPNASTALPGRDVYSRTLFCKPGCLFNVSHDPEERHDLAAAQPALLQDMLAELAKLAKTVWNRPRTRADPACLLAARDLYSGFLGPWLDVATNAAPPAPPLVDIS
jgi:hypothetical protein